MTTDPCPGCSLLRSEFAALRARIEQLEAIASEEPRIVAELRARLPIGNVPDYLIQEEPTLG